MPLHHPSVTKRYFDSVMAEIKNMSGNSFNRETDSLEAVGLVHHHATKVFPEDTDETVTFTADDEVNTFSAWAEIIDNNNVKLSSKFTKDALFTSLLIENCSVKDKVYLIEVAYGADKTVVATYRFLAGETPNLPAVQQIRIRSIHIPAGELVYYHMKCETALATCQLHLRYYLKE